VVPQINLSQNTVLDATGHSVTLSGNHANGVLFVGTNVTAELKGITVANGAAANGAGIVNHGVLYLTNSTLSGNSTAGVGGGIANIVGISYLTNSTVSGNSAGSGGGIWNSIGSAAYLTNSTVSGNSAGSGGGINSSNFVSLTNSIVAQQNQ